jgi:hypothetical protein
VVVTCHIVLNGSKEIFFLNELILWFILNFRNLKMYKLLSDLNILNDVSNYTY